MREILFRGKDAKTGEWLYGWYGKTAFGAWPLKDSIIPAEDAKNGYLRHEQIVPATLGQYTGLNDINGTMIFEGDVVSVLMGHGTLRQNMVGVIEYIRGAFTVAWRIKDYGRHFAGYLDDITVIGNIHDNPKLIKEE